MGNYFSYEYQESDYREKSNGSIAWTVTLAPQNSLPPPKYTQPQQRTTRFLWHFQQVERRRQSAVEAKRAFARANLDRADDAACRRAFNELAKIDLACFKERKVRKQRKRRGNRWTRRWSRKGFTTTANASV